MRTSKKFEVIRTKIKYRHPGFKEKDEMIAERKNVRDRYNLAIGAYILSAENVTIEQICEKTNTNL
jgi:hypothetical protein